MTRCILPAAAAYYVLVLKRLLDYTQYLNQIKRITQNISKKTHKFLSFPFLAVFLAFAFQLHACMDENMDAVCLSSSAAATPIQFVLLLLPGNLRL